MSTTDLNRTSLLNIDRKKAIKIIYKKLKNKYEKKSTRKKLNSN